MLGETDTALTLGGLVALGSLMLAAIGIAVSASARTGALRERLARLEQTFADHLRHHEGKG